ncbi:MAG: YceI family protein [Flavobacteriales bacterium]|nr:YceI family protein [Flavobacteriales bacterium]
MNRTLLMGALATFVLASCGTTEAPSTDTPNAEPTGITGTAIYALDTATSEVDWKGTMLGVKSHTGTLHFVNGELTTINGELSGGSFTVDMHSYTFTDTNYAQAGSKGGTRVDLMNHLMSPDFFAVDSFPTAHFSITKVEGNTATGDLTVRGHTQQEQVKNISLTHEGNTIQATGDLTFNRKNYNVHWDSPMKDMTLSNDIVLTVVLKGTAN